MCSSDLVCVRALLSSVGDFLGGGARWEGRPRAVSASRRDEPLTSPPRHPIRAVSKMTGIAIDTLRAWERRHHAVTPVRDERGRMYSDADVARLRLLQRAVLGGHSIGRLASLSDEQLHALVAAAESDRKSTRLNSSH